MEWRSISFLAQGLTRHSLAPIEKGAAVYSRLQLSIGPVCIVLFWSSCGGTSQSNSPTPSAKRKKSSELLSQIVTMLAGCGESRGGALLMTCMAEHGRVFVANRFDHQSVRSVLQNPARIGAVKMKAALMQQAVPQALKFKCADFISLCPQDGHHFAENGQAALLILGRRARLHDQFPNRFPESPVTRMPIHHEFGEHLFGVEHLHMLFG